MAIQSNAAILPDDDELGDLKSFEKDDTQAAAEPVQTEEDQDQQQQQPAAEDVPDVLKNKSPAELAKMYLDAQRLIGRQGQELGELRRRTDETIKQVLERTAPPKPAEPEPKKPEAADFFADPEKAIARAVEEHPLVKKLLEENERLRGGFEKTTAERNAEQFAKMHPDAGEIIQDNAFREWVGKSPIRRALFVKAHKEFDVVAGDELMSTWKALRGAKQPAAPAPAAKQAAPRADASAAAVPTSNAAGASKGPGVAGSKKVYRRADILRLMEEDPDRYEALADEIRTAYEEGRVR